MIKIPKNLRGTTGVVNSGDAGGVFDRGADWGVIWREFFHVPATPSILKHPRPSRGNGYLCLTEPFPRYIFVACSAVSANFRKCSIVRCLKLQFVKTF